MPSLKLPAVFSDHAVLQHSRSIAVWGWAEAGTRVTVSFRGSQQTATAGADGKFVTHIDTQQPGGPFELVFQAGEEVHTVHDVLVGEVWLCSGQSNMEFPLREAMGAATDIPQFRLSNIRLMSVPQTAAAEPANDVKARWTCCTPETVNNFSGVGAYFGRFLHDELHVPIGLINSSWGGTTAEAWTSAAALKAVPQLEYLSEPREAAGPHEDPGIWPVAAEWMKADLDTSDWQEMSVPQAWERTGLNIDGAVWFRKTIEVPQRWAGKALVLAVDVVDDLDITFFNGREVGRTGTETPNWWSFPRRYVIPAELSVAGKATIAVRVFDQWGDGGLMGKPERMYIAPVDDENDRIALPGKWKFKVEMALEPRFPASAVVATSLFNGMIHPLAPYSIAGAIWYQGESNVDRAFEYRALFPVMIRNWRESFGDDFAFLLVLLAGFHAHPTEPGESKIAELRDAQLAALSLPKVGAASAIDLGDVEDIHPKNKRDVGRRLALIALAQQYGRDIEYSGPTLEKAQLEGRTARLTFRHADGLHVKGEKVLGFAVLDEEGNCRWADAQIDGNAVTLNAPDHSVITSVRYNWDDNPLGNLYNSADLPMLPFRTDDRAYTTAPIAEEYGRLG